MGDLHAVAATATAADPASLSWRARADAAAAEREACAAELSALAEARGSLNAVQEELSVLSGKVSRARLEIRAGTMEEAVTLTLIGPWRKL